MPGFKSLQQMRHLYEKKPLLAAEFAKLTPSIMDLPEVFAVKNIKKKGKGKPSLPVKVKILI